MWDDHTQQLLRTYMKAAFELPGVHFMLMDGVFDLLADIDQDMISKASLQDLRETFIPPKAPFTVSWWLFEDSLSIESPQCLTLSNFKYKAISKIPGLRRVVTIDSIGPPDACCPIVFDYSEEHGYFSPMEYEIIGLI